MTKLIDSTIGLFAGQVDSCQNLPHEVLMICRNAAINYCHDDILTLADGPDFGLRFILPDNPLPLTDSVSGGQASGSPP